MWEAVPEEVPEVEVEEPDVSVEVPAEVPEAEVGGVWDICRGRGWGQCGGKRGCLVGEEQAAWAHQG